MATKKQIFITISISLISAGAAVLATFFWPAFAIFMTTALIATGVSTFTLNLGLLAVAAGAMFGFLAGIITTLVSSIFNLSKSKSINPLNPSSIDTPFEPTETQKISTHLNRGIIALDSCIRNKTRQDFKTCNSGTVLVSLNSIRTLLTNPDFKSHKHTEHLETLKPIIEKLQQIIPDETSADDDSLKAIRSFIQSILGLIAPPITPNSNVSTSEVIATETPIIASTATPLMPIPAAMLATNPNPPVETINTTAAAPLLTEQMNNIDDPTSTNTIRFDCFNTLVESTLDTNNFDKKSITHLVTLLKIELTDLQEKTKPLGTDEQTQRFINNLRALQAIQNNDSDKKIKQPFEDLQKRVKKCLKLVQPPIAPNSTPKTVAASSATSSATTSSSYSGMSVDNPTFIPKSRTPKQQPTPKATVLTLFTTPIKSKLHIKRPENYSPASAQKNASPEKPRSPAPATLGDFFPNPDKDKKQKAKKHHHRDKNDENQGKPGESKINVPH